jgi:hypothetical protein
LLSGRQAFHEPTGGTAQAATVPYNNNNNNNKPDIIIRDNEK